MSRIALFLGFVAIIAVANACASPTSPTPSNRRPAVGTTHDDTGTFCGWTNPNGC